MVDRSSSVPVRSHSGRRAGAAAAAAANVSCSKSFFFINSVYTNNVLSAGVHV